MNISRLLKPQTIAIIGASEGDSYGGFTSRHFSHACKDKIENNKVFFVNPKRETVFGHKCYPNISSLPVDSVDLLIICTPKASVQSILNEGITKDCGAAVVYASGYAETGDAQDVKDEADLKEFCIKHNIALMGPNCGGFYNFVDKIPSMAFVIKERDTAGKIGLVAQSGQVCISMNDSYKTAFSYMISSGNSKIVQIEDYLEFLVDDEDTKVVSAYIEGITQPEKFVSCLKKSVEKKKPIVILKTGKSEKGQLIAASHTGSLSGSDKSFDALCKKFGIIRVDDIEELVSVTSALSILPTLPKSNKFGALNGSGGETAITADCAESYGIDFQDFDAPIVDSLQKFLPSFATVANPLDGTSSICYDEDIYTEVIHTIAKDSKVDAVIVGLTLAPNNDKAPATIIMANGIARMAKESKGQIPVFVIPLIESGRQESLCNVIMEAGVPILPPSKYAYTVIQKIITYSQFLQSVDKRTLALALPKNFDVHAKVTSYSEFESKTLLAKAGIDVPSISLATNEDEAVKFAEEKGYPIVLKIDSPDILHKTEAGGVKLNLKSADEVREAFNTIMSNAKAYKASARINGTLVQTMLDKGAEAIIGINVDPQFGPMIMFGLGGVFVELFKDVSMYPAPCNKFEAMEMINSLTSSKLFTGYRGSAPLDVDALADMIVRISDYAVEKTDTLREMDINPLFVYEKGVGIADALITSTD